MKKKKEDDYKLPLVSFWLSISGFILPIVGMFTMFIGIGAIIFLISPFVLIAGFITSIISIYQMSVRDRSKKYQIFGILSLVFSTIILLILIMAIISLFQTGLQIPGW